MKILGLISSSTDPAARARIIQYKDQFAAAGHTLEAEYFTPLKNADPAPWSYRLKKITGLNEWRSTNFIKTVSRAKLLTVQKGFDLVWQNRLLQSQHFFWENKISRPVIFDFDDAIWLTEGEKEVNRKLGISDMVFAGNEYLAEYANRYNPNVHLVPTTIDTNALYPIKKEIPKFTVGWVGTETNFEYLESIYPALKEFLARNEDSCLQIVSSRLPSFLGSPGEQIVFKPWSAETENEDINSFSMGIMPLTDSDWTRGKCSYKLLQYLACGKPAIASPVGQNKLIMEGTSAVQSAITHQDWLAMLIKMKENPGVATSLAGTGRSFVEKNFSCQVWAPRILQHMKGLC